MKKNIVFGMLVSLLAIPTYTLAQAATDAQASDGAASAEQTEKKEKKDYSHYSAGSSINLGFGLGQSGMVVGGNNVYSEPAFPSYNASLRYTYYVYKYLGITTGVDFSQYAATIGMKGTMDWQYGQTVDQDPAKRYTMNRLVDFDAQDGTGSQWSEMETVSMIEVPLALTFKAKPHKVGFIGTIGLKVGFPIMGTYQYKGNLNLLMRNEENIGYRQNNVNNAGCVVMGLNYDSQAKYSYKNNIWSTVNGQVFAEAGVLFQLHPRLDLSLSVFGTYGLNNISAADNILGFSTDIYRENAMPDYAGLLGTNAVSKANPWNVGGKIALHINCRKKSDEQIAAEAYISPEVVYVYDTVVQVQKEVVHDTITLEINTIDSTNAWVLNQKSAIYYRLGDALHPIIQPDNLLDLLSSALVGNRAARVIIAGYASAEGSASYNERLSLKRAETIAAMLRARGVRETQMEIASYGDSKSSRESAPEDFVRDRRVEIIPVK